MEARSAFEAGFLARVVLDFVVNFELESPDLELEIAAFELDKADFELLIAGLDAESADLDPDKIDLVLPFGFKEDLLAPSWTELVPVALSALLATAPNFPRLPLVDWDFLIGGFCPGSGSGKGLTESLKIIEISLSAEIGASDPWTAFWEPSVPYNARILKFSKFIPRWGNFFSHHRIRRSS